MKTYKLRVRGGWSFAIVFWIACLTLIFIPVALFDLLNRLEIYEDDELERMRAVSPARIREFMQ